MEHTDIRRELSSRIRMLLAASDPTSMPFRPYQSEAIGKTADWLEDPSGTPRGHIVHATGLGKTIQFSAMMKYMEGLRALVVVPSKVLVEQTARVIARVTGGMVGHLSSLDVILDTDGSPVATRGHHDHSIVVTTDMTLKAQSRRIAQDFDPHFIVRDECHWSYSHRCQGALACFPKSVILGFTATPDYIGNVAKPGYVPVQLEHGQVLYGHPSRFAKTHFGERIDTKTVRWGIENGYLAPLAWGSIDFGASLDGVPIQETRAGLDYNEGALQQLMKKNWGATCETIRRLYEQSDYDFPSRQVFAICPGVAQAKELAHAISGIGIAAACITGDTSEFERQVLLEAFNTGDITFLSSVMVLREGWDAPNAEVCFMLRPTKSRVLYEQGLGRGLRLPESKPDKVALAIDIHFQNTTFAPLSAPAIYGSPGERIKSDGMLLFAPDREDDEGESSLSSLPVDVQPRINVVPATQIEFRVGPHQTFAYNGEVYAGEDALALLFDTSTTEFWKKAFGKTSGIRKRVAYRGQTKILCFCVSDTERAMGTRIVRKPMIEM